MKNFKFSILKIIFLLSVSSLLIGANSFPKSFSAEELENSVVVDLDSLEISMDGIFLQHLDGWKKIDCLFEDVHGKYRATLKSPSNEWDFHWICPKCGFKNGTFAKVCGNCGYRPGAPDS
ncbi:zinc ribbon domain-containing protein [Simkania negevensis]|uniref:RanBP2-type domain-containing protein n=1 Tax=Simkania negevensis (strain ATCC VR-1471 / DSM 27360 / Z) TaxID=331113 RepID=F8L2X1_SIMNZ|nr:zinc ribbon domain-containing protein [Simkania negevensis]CCB87817.1 unknown protein [Simkania negevensis Z]